MQSEAGGQQWRKKCWRNLLMIIQLDNRQKIMETGKVYCDVAINSKLLLHSSMLRYLDHHDTAYRNFRFNPNSLQLNQIEFSSSLLTPDLSDWIITDTATITFSLYISWWGLQFLFFSIFLPHFIPYLKLSFVTNQIIIYFLVI